MAQGGEVHWCRTAAEARDAVLAICRAAGARTVTKGKTMVGEEIAINGHLEANGIKPVETDLGEYIIQLRREPPSHIVAPAVHLAKEQVAESFRAAHKELDLKRPLDEPRQMLDEARAILRRQLPRRRGRHHRRQFPRRRDRVEHHRHQRGQWRPDPDAAQGAYRAGLDR